MTNASSMRAYVSARGIPRRASMDNRANLKSKQQGIQRTFPPNTVVSLRRLSAATYGRSRQANRFAATSYILVDHGAKDTLPPKKYNLHNRYDTKERSCSHRLNILNQENKRHNKQDATQVNSSCIAETKPDPSLGRLAATLVALDMAAKTIQS